MSFNFGGSKLPMPVAIVRTLVWTQAALLLVEGLGAAAMGLLLNTTTDSGIFAGGSRGALYLGAGYFILGIVLAYAGIKLSGLTETTRISIAVFEVVVLAFLIATGGVTGSLLMAALIAATLITLFMPQTSAAFASGPVSSSRASTAAAADGPMKSSATASDAGQSSDTAAVGDSSAVAADEL